MNRTELIFGMAIILFVAFALGWFACWLLNRFARVPGAETDELERLAVALHETEEQRDEAVLYFEQREAELSNRLAQTEAELRATMDGLRNARGENEHLRTLLEQRR